jgi:hypothetical protein
MPKKKTYSSKRGKPQRKSSKLPLFLTIGGVLALLITAFFAFQKKATPYISEVTGGPSLKVDKEKVDLGDLKLGSPVKVSFEITNVGDKPLRFEESPYVEVREGC